MTAIGLTGVGVMGSRTADHLTEGSRLYGDLPDRVQGQRADRAGRGLVRHRGRLPSPGGHRGPARRAGGAGSGMVAAGIGGQTTGTAR